MKRGLALSSALLSLALGGFVLAPQAGADEADAPPRAVVLAGISGLTWNDISQEQTPTLWALVGQSASGTELIRGVYQRACVADTWLTLGTGQRTAAARRVDDRGLRACPPVEPPAPVGDVWRVTDWDELPEANAGRYDPTFGLVTDSLAAAGQCSTAVGAGAALMMADAAGVVRNYYPVGTTIDRGLLNECALTAVDLGELPPLPDTRMRSQDTSGGDPFDGSRDEALVALDESVASLLAALPAGATFILNSTGDETPVARLRVLMALGPGPGTTVYANGLLTTASTRQPGLVQITDVTAMVLGSLDVPPTATIVGTAPTVAPWPKAIEERILIHERQDQLAQAILRITFPINQALLLIGALLYGGVGGYAMVARRRARPETWRAPSWMNPFLRVGSLLLASVPLATYAVNLVPWWHLADGPATGRATAAMLALATLLAIGFTAAALLPHRWQTPYRPVGFLAIATALVMTADVMTGSRLQIGSVLGLSPLVGGRFFGFGNVAFAVFATASLFAIVGLSAPIMRRGNVRGAVAVVLSLGLLAALVDGWPTFGADFGGMLAIMSGIGTFALVLAGRAIRARWFAAIAVAAVAVTTAVAMADWLRPESERTHLGDFVASVIDGEALTVVRRKLVASLESFTYLPLAPVVPVLLITLAFVVLRPERMRAYRLKEAYALTPTLRAGLIGALVVAVVGTLVNDSGIIVPATMLSFAVPLGVAAAAFDRRTAPQATSTDPPAVPSSR